MSIRLIVCAALISLSACATVIDETSEVRELPDGFFAGYKYFVRTQTLSGAQGEYERTSVVYRSVSRVCIKDSPKDCEKAARLLIEECDASLTCI